MRKAAQRAMQDWLAWAEGVELSSPGEDSIIRAMHQAETATKTDGYRRKNGPEPPDVKSTRASPGCIIPNISRAKIGPAVNRYLLDLVENGELPVAVALYYDTRFADRPQKVRALAASVNFNTFKSRCNRGYAYISRSLSFGGSFSSRN